jgi:hypothetical protein
MYSDRPLLDYLPEVLQEVREYQALTFGEQPEIFALFEGAKLALNNNFVATSDEYGVRRWEKILDLSPRGGLTLDERKFAILARLTEKLPFTYRMLRSFLDTLCGENYDLELIHNDYQLRVIIEQTAGIDFGAVIEMLGRVAPCNLVLKMIQRLYPGDLPLRAGMASRTYSREVLYVG